MIDRTTATRIPKFVPFQEAVTYHNRTSGDSFGSQSVVRARRKKVEKQDGNFSPDILNTAELMWQIASVYLSVTPKTDDYLTDSSSVKWIVVAVTLQMNGGIFNILCRKEA